MKCELWYVLQYGTRELLNKPMWLDVDIIGNKIILYLENIDNHPLFECHHQGLDKTMTKHRLKQYSEGRSQPKVILRMHVHMLNAKQQTDIKHVCMCNTTYQKFTLLQYTMLASVLTSIKSILEYATCIVVLKTSFSGFDVSCGCSRA